MARDGQVCTPLGTLVRNRLTALETLNNSALVKRDTSSKAVTNFLVPPPPPPELHRRWKRINFARVLVLWGWICLPVSSKGRVHRCSTDQSV